MEIDVTKPFWLGFEKFQLADSKKNSINPYMTGKILRKKYEDSGYKVLQSADFETSLLLDFVKKHRYLDKYIKVKLGEYLKNQKTENYNKQVLEILGSENIEKLLFVCRVCSYLGDPSFPDFIIFKGGVAGLRYVYTGDEVLTSKIIFILLLKPLADLEITFCGLEFSDFKQAEKLQADLGKNVEEVIKLLAGRVNSENSAAESGFDFNIFSGWAENKNINTGDVAGQFENFMKKAAEKNKLKEILEKMEKIDVPTLISGKTKPEKLAALRQALGINMLEANDALNLYEIVKD